MSFLISFALIFIFIYLFILLTTFFKNLIQLSLSLLFFFIVVNDFYDILRSEKKVKEIKKNVEVYSS